MHTDIYDTVEREFWWARSLTVDLLRTCGPEDLGFRLGEPFGEVWRQFRHVARVHENYLSALRSRVMAFGFDGCHYAGGASLPALLGYFEEVERRHRIGLADFLGDPSAIDWFGEPDGICQHLARLLAHETLHHGQFILLWRHRARPLPDSWAGWGE